MFDCEWVRCAEDSLLFTHHMNEFDASECNVGSGFRLETERGSYPAFDAAMVLLNGVIHVFARADRNGVTRVFQPVFCIALQDGNIAIHP